MNLHQLKFITEAIKKQFNLSEVAKALYLSQPGISKAIMQFEDELNLQIFHRKSKRLDGLTEAGKLILPHIQIIMREIEQIKSLAKQSASPNEGILRIGTTHTQAKYTLPFILNRFRESYPKVKLSLTQGNPQHIVQLLKDDLIDIAIASEIYPEPNLTIFPAFSWQHLLIAPKSHAIFNAPINLEQLVKYPLITYEPSFSGRHKIDEAFMRQHLQADIVLEAMDSDIIKTYVGFGMGIGIIAELAFQKDKDHHLHSYGLEAFFGKHQVKAAMYALKYQRPYMSEFLKLLQNYQHA